MNISSRKTQITYTFLALNIFLCMIEAKYSVGMNPGIMVRLEQNTINQFKNAMEQFLPHYMNFDVNLPHEYHNKFNLFFDSFRMSLDWNNITYSDVDLDIADIQLELKR